MKFGKKSIWLLSINGQRLGKHQFRYLSKAVKGMILDSLKTGEPRMLYDNERGRDLCTFRPPGWREHQKGLLDIHAPKLFARLLLEAPRGR